MASCSPTVRLRDRLPVAVSTRSPKPDRPMNVSARAPRATPRRVISAKPRVISAARAFSPRFRPSAMPVAMASTFFTAPPTSTPIGSVEVYTRRLSEWKAATACSAKAVSRLAATRAVGWPNATSLAKLGPDSTPLRACGRKASAISWPRRPLPFSKPLHNHSAAASSGKLCSMLPSAAMGVPMMTNPSVPRACATASFRSWVSRRLSGNGASGR